jgi:hypothetical protein
VRAGDSAAPYWRSQTTPRALPVTVEQYKFVGTTTHHD